MPLARAKSDLWQCLSINPYKPLNLYASKPFLKNPSPIAPTVLFYFHLDRESN